MRYALFVTLLAACGGNPSSMGDDDASTTGPNGAKLIATGGVADAPLASRLNVYVVEVNSSTPIADASVRVETATPLVATTDATGLTSFSDPSLANTVTITASAPGHTPATWIGVAGSNATLPLAASSSTLPTAHVTGTIAGWDNLPGPSFGHYTLGVVLYSFLDDPSAPENAIVQPTNSGTPLDTCINDGFSSSTCAWQLTTRIGPQIHTAVIVDGNAHGTSSDTSDDTYTLIGYAAGTPMTLTANQQVVGESLAMVASTMPLAVTFPAAPVGLPRIIAVPELALGDAGRIVFPLPTVTPSAASTTVLSATGAFAGHYEIVALATPSAAVNTPFASSFVHDATSPAALPSWFAAPTALQAGATFAFTSASSAFHTAQLTRSGQTLWNITILDGTTTFTLPALSPDPIGAGSTTFAVNAADLPSFDPKHFDVASTTTTLVRVAGAQSTFTH